MQSPRVLPARFRKLLLDTFLRLLESEIPDSTPEQLRIIQDENAGRHFNDDGRPIHTWRFLRQETIVPPIAEVPTELICKTTLAYDRLKDSPLLLDLTVNYPTSFNVGHKTSWRDSAEFREAMKMFLQTIFERAGLVKGSHIETESNVWTDNYGGLSEGKMRDSNITQAVNVPHIKQAMREVSLALQQEIEKEEKGSEGNFWKNILAGKVVKDPNGMDFH